jgi:putative flippase GtrA
MIRHFLTRQFATFVLVGGTAAFFNWASRLIFSFWFSFQVSVVLAYMIGMTLAFYLNRIYVFNRSDRPIARQARDFIFTNIVFLPVVLCSSVLLEKMLRSVGINLYTEAIAHGFSVALPAVLSFLLYKFVAFRETGNEQN